MRNDFLTFSLVEPLSLQDFRARLPVTAKNRVGDGAEDSATIGEILQDDAIKPAAKIVIDPQRRVIVTVVATAVDPGRDLLYRRMRMNVKGKCISHEKFNEVGSI